MPQFPGRHGWRFPFFAVLRKVGGNGVEKYLCHLGKAWLVTLFLFLSNASQTAELPSVKPNPGDSCWRLDIAEPATEKSRLWLLALSANTRALRHTHRDARRIAEKLSALFVLPPERMCILEQVSRDEFTRALRRLAEPGGISHNDVLVLFFSGHGAKVSDDDGDESGHGAGADPWDEIFVTADMGERPAPDDVLRDDAFSRLLAGLPTEQVVSIFDACFSADLHRAPVQGDVPKFTLFDSLLRGNPEQPVITRAGTPDVGKGLVLAASQEGQLAFERPSLGGGIFTHVFLDVLEKTMGAGGKPDLIGIMEKVEARVRQETEGWQRPAVRGDRRLRDVLTGFTRP